MKSRNFRELIENKWSEGRFVCVGLDTDYEKIPTLLRDRIWQEAEARTPSKLSVSDEVMLEFNCSIIDATADLVCAYKPNTAFYEPEGTQGILALGETIQYIHNLAPDVPVILDAKRADIGNTNKGYVKFAFEYLKADAITVHPYLGSQAMQPFLDCKDKGIFVLCKTSNPGADEFQDMTVLDQIPLYQRVAYRVAGGWDTNRNCGLVVGATYPEDLAAVRNIVEEMPILIPGIGAQGGDLEATVRAGKDSRGRGMIINSSRGIIFASSGSDFVDAARRETEKLHSQITACLKS